MRFTAHDRAHVTPVLRRRVRVAGVKVTARARRCASPMSKAKGILATTHSTPKGAHGRRKVISPEASSVARIAIRDPRQDSPYRRLHGRASKRPRASAAGCARGAPARCGTTTGSTPSCRARRARGLPRGRQRAAVRRRPDGAQSARARAVPERAHGGQHRGVLGEDAGARGGGVRPVGRRIRRRRAAPAAPRRAQAAAASGGGAAELRVLHGALKADAPPGRLRPVRAAAARPPRRPRPQRPPSALEPEGLLRRARRRRLARRVGGAVRVAPHGVLLKSRPRDVAAPPRGGRRQRARLRAGRRAAMGRAALAPFVLASERARPRRQRGARRQGARDPLHHAADARITALDRSARKVRELPAALALGRRRSRLHRVACGDAVEPGGWWDGEQFDAIVLDAPCSATGILRVQARGEAPPGRSLGRRLGRGAGADAARAVEPNPPRRRAALHDVLALRAENDAIVASFVDAHADAAVRPLAPPPPAAAAHATATGVTFFPSHAHAGGLCAMLRKAE